MRQIVILLVSSFLISCAHTDKNAAEINLLKSQMREMQAKLKRAESKIEEQDTKILLLSDKVKFARPDQISNSENDSTPSGDVKLSQLIQERAGSNDFSEMERLTELMIKGYRDSLLTPKAMMIVANEYLHGGHFEKSLVAYQRIIDLYPSDPEVLPALLGKASGLTKLGKVKAAREIYLTITQLFPGSREAELSQRNLEGAN